MKTPVPLLRNEQGAPQGDYQGVGYHAGPDAACFSIRHSVEYTRDGSYGGETPVRERVEEKMGGAEQQRSGNEGEGPVAGPSGEPLLQEAAKEKLFGQRDHPQGAEEVRQSFPEEKAGGEVEVNHAHPQGQGETDGKKIEEVLDANDPFFLGRKETEAKTLDAAQFEHGERTGANQH